jgi:hypothetical protein
VKRAAALAALVAAVSLAAAVPAAPIQRADAIIVSTAYVPFVQNSRSRDAYCAAHVKR